MTTSKSGTDRVERRTKAIRDAFDLMARLVYREHFEDLDARQRHAVREACKLGVIIFMATKAEEPKL